MLLRKNVTVVELDKEFDLYLSWLNTQSRLMISGTSNATIIGYDDSWWIFTNNLIDSNSIKPVLLPHQKLYSDNVLLINYNNIGIDIKKVICIYTYDWRYAHKFWNKMIDNNIFNYKKIIYDNVDNWINKIDDLSKNYINRIIPIENRLSIVNDFSVYNRSAVIMSILNHNDWQIDWSYNTVRPGSKLASKWKTILQKNDYIIDFRASHMYRLAKEINYVWKDYPYLEMSKKIFDKDEISEEEIAAVKLEVFSMLYGNEFDSKSKIGIDFLDRVKEYKLAMSNNCEFEKTINDNNWWNIHVNLLELNHVVNWIWERIDFFINGEIKLKGYVYDSVVVNIPNELKYKEFMGEDIRSSELKIKRRK